MALELTERGIGLELIQREVSKILYNELNDEIDAQATLWAQRDLDWNALTGQEPSVIELEHVDDLDFYLGHRPSLVKPEYPIERFPNVSVMSYTGRPLTALTEVIDQATNFQVTVDIETFVKAQTAYECDARNHRTAEAVHQIMTRNNKLNGLSLGWQNDPIVQNTDIMERQENISYGEDWFWQGTRIRYNLSRHTKLPS